MKDQIVMKNIMTRQNVQKNFKWGIALEAANTDFSGSFVELPVSSAFSACIKHQKFNETIGGVGKQCIRAKWRLLPRPPIVL